MARPLSKQWSTSLRTDIVAVYKIKVSNEELEGKFFNERNGACGPNNHNNTKKVQWRAFEKYV